MYDFFFSGDPGFGSYSWLLMLGWLLALAVGVYLYSLWQERNPVRARFFRRFGLGMSILSAAGLLVLALKALSVPYAEWRIWTYVAALLTLLFFGWAGWFWAARMPRLLASTGRQSGRPAGGARTYSSNGGSPATPRPPSAPRPVATTGRRDARRDKKRKSR